MSEAAWAGHAALAAGAFAGAFLIGRYVRTGLHASYVALAAVLLLALAQPWTAAPAEPGTGLPMLPAVLMAAVLGACGFALGRYLRRRAAERGRE